MNTWRLQGMRQDATAGVWGGKNQWAGNGRDSLTPQPEGQSTGVVGWEGRAGSSGGSVACAKCPPQHSWGTPAVPRSQMASKQPCKEAGSASTGS